MSTFALVHGSWHGAWCWERLTPELESMGHRVIAMDLPSDDAAASFDDYADSVCAALVDCVGSDLIVVGHSLAGLTIPLIAERRPVRRLVYLCAMPPIPGQSFRQQLTDESDMVCPGYLEGLSELDSRSRRTWINKELARFHMFGDCDEATATWAFERLRPQATAHYELPCSLRALPDLDSAYVLCTTDRLVNPDWSRRIACERLHAELVELPGSHSPFLSRPAVLAGLLDQLAPR
jgi:pimeloyl-ACP methyl ester carboxylesterase